MYANPGRTQDCSLWKPEVVRCKDCKHRKEWIDYGQFHCGHETDGMAYSLDLRDDDFCSYGERKDND